MSYWRDKPNNVRNRERACLAALELHQHLCRSGNLDTAHFPTRIGLHAGPVILSGVSVGEARVPNLAGDGANTAARLQELCKLLGTWVLASTEAVAGARCVETRKIGRFLLVGRDEPIEVVELLAEKGHLTPEQEVQRTAFLSAAGVFQNVDRSGAESRLAELIQQCPQDRVPRFLLAVARGEIPTVARMDSDGVISMMVK
jgi:adenylate cyclase